jgi:hypothetical protein
MSSVTHSAKQLQILDKFFKRLKKERFVNNNSSTYYGTLNQRFIIPGIVITGLSSIGSFMTTSDMLSDDEKQGFGVTVGILTAVSTVVQSMSASFGFQLKKDAFATSADVYDSLITKVEFEICNPNENFEDFCNNLEDEILKIKSDCKYLIPLHIQQLWEQNKHLYTQSLSPSTSEVVVIENVGESSTDPDPDKENGDSPKIEISGH